MAEDKISKSAASNKSVKVTVKLDQFTGQFVAAAGKDIKRSVQSDMEILKKHKIAG